MKKLVLTTLFTACTAAVMAQSSSSQNVSMGVSGTIELTFTGSGTTTGNAVGLNFSTANDYANGVTSTDQQLKVVSNRNFTIAVKTSSSDFTYSGTVTPTPTMPVSGILGVAVSANSTGGTIASPFSASSYASLSGSNQNLINIGTAGTNQLFSVKYKATPGFNYPSGTYTVNVVYTATQL